MASPNLDLTLPPFTPELTHDLQGTECSAASFAIYTLIPGISCTRLAEIAAIPQEEWESFGMDTPAVKPGMPRYDFSGQTLRDIVAAHISMDKQIFRYEGGLTTAAWWPHVFIVVTGEDIEDHGLMLVYGFEPLPDEDEGEGENETNGNDGGGGPSEPVMGKFFFKPKHMCSILGNFALSGDSLDYLHMRYDMDGDMVNESDDDEGEEDGGGDLGENGV